jgi:hypothetical protein
MTASTCEGVAAEFIGQLGSAEAAVRADSGGRIVIEPIIDCSSENIYADPAAGCWRARAQTTAERSCMVIGRARSVYIGMDFIKLRGDSYQKGFGPEPPRPGTNPC